MTDQKVEKNDTPLVEVRVIEPPSDLTKIDAVEIRRDFSVSMQSFLKESKSLPQIVNVCVGDTEGKDQGVHECAVVSFDDRFEYQRPRDSKQVDDMKGIFGADFRAQSELGSDTRILILFHNGYGDLDTIAKHMRAKKDAVDEKILIGDSLYLLKKILKFPDEFNAKWGLQQLCKWILPPRDGSGHAHQALCDAYELRRLLRFVLLWVKKEIQTGEVIPLKKARQVINTSHVLPAVYLHGLLSFIDTKVKPEKGDFWRKISVDQPRSYILRSFAERVMPTVYSKNKPKKRNGVAEQVIHYKDICAHAKKNSMVELIPLKADDYKNFRFCTTCCFVYDMKLVPNEYINHINQLYSPLVVYEFLTKK